MTWAPQGRGTPGSLVPWLTVSFLALVSGEAGERRGAPTPYPSQSPHPIHFHARCMGRHLLRWQHGLLSAHPVDHGGSKTGGKYARLLTGTPRNTCGCHEYSSGTKRYMVGFAEAALVATRWISESLASLDCPPQMRLSPLPSSLTPVAEQAHPLSAASMRSSRLGQGS